MTQFDFITPIRACAVPGNVEVMAAPDNCYETPTKAECEDYQYPESRTEGDIGMLCNAMPDMPGCSLWEACKVRDAKQRCVLAGAGIMCESVRDIRLLCNAMHDSPGCTQTVNCLTFPGLRAAIACKCGG
eukprot:1162142-Pelagomonas_calceolata.AAC.21